MSIYTNSKKIFSCIFFLGFVLLAYGQQAPFLYYPPTGSILSNGTLDLKQGNTWNFTWEAVPYAQQYQLQVSNIYGGPSFDRYLSTTSYYHFLEGTYIPSQFLNGWHWKVRAEVNRVWGPWSEVRYFNVAPAEEKAVPFNFLGDGLYRIQGTYYQYFLAIKTQWYGGVSEPMVDIDQNGGYQALFQFEGTSFTEEIYYIKVYVLPPGGVPEYVGYLNYQMGVDQSSGGHIWAVSRANNAMQLQIPRSNEVLQLHFDAGGWRVKMNPNNNRQDQYFRLIQY